MVFLRTFPTKTARRVLQPFLRIPTFASLIWPANAVEEFHAGGARPFFGIDDLKHKIVLVTVEFSLADEREETRKREHVFNVRVGRGLALVKTGVRKVREHGCPEGDHGKHGRCCC